MDPDEKISATAEAPTIHHLPLSIAPSLFGDTATEFTLLCHRRLPPNPIVS
jgi:hypothetical protein